MLSTVQSLTCDGFCPSGYMSIPGNSSANFTFTLASDDGSMLYIDGALVVNNTGAGLRQGWCSSACACVTETSCNPVQDHNSCAVAANLPQVTVLVHRCAMPTLVSHILGGIRHVFWTARASSSHTGTHGFSPAPTGTLLLTPQLHAIRVEYFNVRLVHDCVLSVCASSELLWTPEPQQH